MELHERSNSSLLAGLLHQPALDVPSLLLGTSRRDLTPIEAPADHEFPTTENLRLHAPFPMKP
jgi:hypothetical protein